MTAGAWDLGPVDQLPLGEGRVFRVDGRDVALFRARDGRVHATQASCPHRGGPLADGVIGAGRVICPLHGRVFDLASGRPVGNTSAPLVTYPVAIEGGRFVVRLDGATPPTTIAPAAP